MHWIRLPSGRYFNLTHCSAARPRDDGAILLSWIPDGATALKGADAAALRTILDSLALLASAERPERL